MFGLVLLIVVVAFGADIFVGAVQVAMGLLCGLAIVPSGNFSPHPLGVAWEARVLPLCVATPARLFVCRGPGLAPSARHVMHLQRLPGRRPGRGGPALPGRRSFLPASARRKRALRGVPDGVTLVLTVISFP